MTIVVLCDGCGEVIPQDDATDCIECELVLCDLCAVDHDCDEALTALLEAWS